MSKIQHNLQTIGTEIAGDCQRFGRDAASVTLLAVSKRHPASAIREAYDCGQRAFGENYVQEMLEKAEQLGALDIAWHFIGPLQSNKTKDVAKVASWVHTIDRLKIARRLSEQRPQTLAPLNVCLQVNVNNEASKSGVSLDELGELLESVSGLPNITVRGLMAIPEATNDTTRQRQNFRLLADAMARLNAMGYQLDTLSMGMSDDMDAAIAEGATIVRIGTAIFGERPTA